MDPIFLPPEKFSPDDRANWKQVGDVTAVHRTGNVFDFTMNAGPGPRLVLLSPSVFRLRFNAAGNYKNTIQHRQYAPQRLRLRPAGLGQSPDVPRREGCGSCAVEAWFLGPRRARWSRRSAIRPTGGATTNPAIRPTSASRPNADQGLLAFLKKSVPFFNLCPPGHVKWGYVNLVDTGSQRQEK
jgi:hypothetical protein